MGMKLITKLQCNDDSWIELYSLDTRILSEHLYTDYYSLKPKERGWVKVFDKATSTYKDKQIYRSYVNYLNTPRFDPTTKKSYMFNKAGYVPLPEIYQGIYHELLYIDPGYNQAVVNYYDSGLDYIEGHSDCTAKFKKPDSPVAIITLNEGAPRKMHFSPRYDEDDPEFSLTLEHGQVLIMGGKFQYDYRHRIDPDPEIKTSRISLTFRQMKVDDETGAV